MMVPFERKPHFPVNRRHVIIACVFLLLCLQFPSAHTADLDELHVSENQGVYRINLVMQMQAPAHYVHGVLTDYKHIYRLDPAIVDSEILPSPDDGVVRVKTRITDCIAFFCMMIDRVEDVRELESGGLQATIVPTLSNFKYGHAEWKIVDQGDRTKVIYQAQIEPNFFIPPLIGSYFVKKKLRKRGLTSMARIECIARIQAGLEPDFLQKPLLVTDEQTGNQPLEAALQAGEDPTLVAQAPAAGNTVREASDCSRPCRINNIACQP
jgi:hypothetical protein